MTRTKPCTTSVTCFSINSLCSVYSGRNTFAWASARTVKSSFTPKGVDGQHESKNNMLSTGGMTAKFHRELAISDWILQVVKGYSIEFTSTPYASIYLQRYIPL